MRSVWCLRPWHDNVILKLCLLVFSFYNPDCVFVFSLALRVCSFQCFRVGLISVTWFDPGSGVKVTKWAAKSQRVWINPEVSLWGASLWREQRLSWSFNLLFVLLWGPQEDPVMAEISCVFNMQDTHTLGDAYMSVSWLPIMSPDRLMPRL